MDFAARKSTVFGQKSTESHAKWGKRPLLLSLGRRCRRFESCHSDQKATEGASLPLLLFRLNITTKDLSNRYAIWSCLRQAYIKHSRGISQTQVLNPVTPAKIGFGKQFPKPFSLPSATQFLRADGLFSVSPLLINRSTNWNLTLLQFENLFLYYFFAPSAFVAFRTLQIPCRSPMHRIKCLLIGRYDLVAAIFALISPHADFKLYRIDARYQKHNTNTENGDKLPYSFGYQKCGNKDTCN